MNKELEHTYRIVIKNIFSGLPFTLDNIKVREFDDINQVVMEELLSIKNGVRLENISYDNENYALFHSVEHIINNDWVSSHVKVYKMDNLWDLFLIKLMEMRNNG